MTIHAPNPMGDAACLHNAVALGFSAAHKPVDLSFPRPILNLAECSHQLPHTDYTTLLSCAIKCHDKTPQSPTESDPRSSNSLTTAPLHAFWHIPRQPTQRKASIESSASVAIIQRPQSRLPQCNRAIASANQFALAPCPRYPRISRFPSLSDPLLCFNQEPSANLPSRQSDSTWV